MISYSKKINDLELRTSRSIVTGVIYIEIVRWEKDDSDRNFCYSLGYWLPSDEEYDFKFIGSRPLNDAVDWKTFRELLVIGQALTLALDK